MRNYLLASLLFFLTALPASADFFSFNGVTVGTGLSLSSSTLTVSGAPVVTSITANHYLSSGAPPTIAAGAGAGSSPTVAISGTDRAGYITVTSGTLPTLSAIIATITYAVAYTTIPNAVLLTAANSNAALLSGANMVFINQAGLATGTFAITAGTTALTPATIYQWYYEVQD